MARELPTGTVTFVFTDVEGSTRLLQQLGAEAYADALAQHRRALREAFIRYDGVEVDTQGDSFFIAFSTAPAPIAAAAEAQQVLLGSLVDDKSLRDLGGTPRAFARLICPMAVRLERQVHVCMAHLARCPEIGTPARCSHTPRSAGRST